MTLVTRAQAACWQPGRALRLINGSLWLAPNQSLARPRPRQACPAVLSRSAAFIRDSLPVVFSNKELGRPAAHEPSGGQCGAGDLSLPARHACRAGRRAPRPLGSSRAHLPLFVLEQCSTKRRPHTVSRGAVWRACLLLLSSLRSLLAIFGCNSWAAISAISGRHCG